MDRPLVAFLTGAGISTDSGIPDYRGPDGLWTRHPEYEKLVTYEYYMTDPDVRRRSWQMRRELSARRPQPNAAHHAIATLARSGAASVRVITQNVDGLHQDAGLPPEAVLEIHGTTRFVTCTSCGYRDPAEETFARIDAGEPDPPCPVCGGVLKTATVMFGEPLDPALLTAATAIVRQAAALFAVGTSLQVHPAAGLVDLAVDAGARLVIVNATPTPYDHLAEAVVREPIGQSLPRLLAAYEAP